MTAYTCSRPVNRGVSLLSMAIVLAIVLVAAPIGMEKYASQLEEQSWTVTASHMDTVNNAARLYIRDNYQQLINKLSSSPNSVVQRNLVEFLIQKNYLPAGFSNVNNNHQQYTLGMRGIAKTGGKITSLDALVLTEAGAPFSPKGRRIIAQQITNLGGYLDEPGVNNVIDAKGAAGGWKIELSQYGLTGEEGHLAVYLTAEQLQSDADSRENLLHRNEVAAHPEYNQMETALDMDGNNLVDVGRISTRMPIRFTSHEIEGDACDFFRSIATNTKGHLMTCQPKLSAPGQYYWRKVVNVEYRKITGKPAGAMGISKATCPLPYQLMSGGFQAGSWYGGGGASRNSPDASFPSFDVATGRTYWEVHVPNFVGHDMSAVALCALYD